MIAAQPETPLEYMLRIMRDEAGESKRRDEMAKAAAPYLHPRLSSVEHTGEDEAFPKAADLTDDQLAAIVAGAKLTIIKTARRLRVGPPTRVPQFKPDRLPVIPPIGT